MKLLSMRFVLALSIWLLLDSGCTTIKNTGSKGLAAKYYLDTGIQKDDAVIFSSSFENGFEGWTSHCDNCDIVAANSSDSEKMLRITATKNVNTGGDAIYRFPKGEDEIFFRFYTYFTDSAVTPHHFVKVVSYPVPYSGGNAGKRPPENKYFVLGIEPTSDNKWHLYNYWQNMHSWQTYRGDPDPSRGPNAYYGNTFEPDNQVPFKRNTWICVEVKVSLNDPRDSNGEMVIWIDGVQIGRWGKGFPAGTWRGDRFLTSGPENIHPQPFEGFRFRSTDSLRINQINLQWYVSDEHAAAGKAQKNMVYFDDVVVARKYIGPRNTRAIGAKK